MSKIIWTTELNTNIEVIDRQHRQIVAYMNELDIAIALGDTPGVKNVIEELIGCMLSHFSFEESLLEKSDYPFYQAHKRVHQQFTKRIVEFQSRAEKGENVAEEMLSMLRKWLINHIKGDDVDYVDKVNKFISTEFASQKQEKPSLKTVLSGFFNRSSVKTN